MVAEGIIALICQIDYSIVWRYFTWANQTLAMIALWAAAMYLSNNKKNHWICTIPATFMSAVSMTYFIAAPECMGLLWTPMGLAYDVYYPIALVGGAIFAVLFLGIFLKSAKQNAAALK